MDRKTNGFWSIAARKHLKEFVDYSDNGDIFDRLNVAGKTGLFLGTIRGNKQLDNIKKIEKMASQVGIKPIELHKIILPQLEESSDKKIEIHRDSLGNATGIEEYVFDTQSTLEITGKVFEDLNPTDKEIITVNTLEETKKVPYTQNEITEIMVQKGFKENDINISLDIADQFKLIRKVAKKNDPIISNEYIWGSNNQRIALAVGELGKIQKDSLGITIGEIQNCQGIPYENLTIADKKLFDLAKKIGMINPIKIVTNRNVNKEFEFTQSTNWLPASEDIFDDVRLLLASIRFGENYTQHSTIYSAQKFLSAWIRNGEVGPHDANSTDYIMLEKKGIAKVVYKSKQKWGYNGYYNATGYYLELVKEDVAREALKFINGIIEENDLSIDDYNQIAKSSNYYSAEEQRVRMGDVPESSKEADEYIQRILRDENY
ncbi:hypothetical protein [Simiaoa sunii]|jgi:hypothetical protein|uniref:Uncharacterized protein n=1 Tax=Simiaoa sunii TaxID=2763672 RepID=A0A7G9FT20_9FIRM|nr:hypothetical protein [Simiaoa sunii]QNM01702.1 hypothetical protein H9Q77_11410 [Simiaoa sunii]